MIIVQLKVPLVTSLKLLHFNKFIEALYEDPDLASIPKLKRAIILQILYISTGCDLISFFVGFGKTAFLKTFFFLEILNFFYWSITYLWISL